MAEVHAAVLAAADEPLRSEPVLAAEVAASTRANVLHLAACMLKDPGGRVPANLTPEVVGIAREAFRRGIEQTVYTTYHTGQNIVWAYWMRTAFSLSQDPAVLRQALAAGSRSVAGFVEDMVAALSEQLRRERAELARSSHARRFEVVSLILESAPITTGRASTRLRCTPTATRSSTASSAPSGCSRSRWPGTASRSASPSRSPSGWARNPAVPPVPGDVRTPRAMSHRRSCA